MGGGLLPGFLIAILMLVAGLAFFRRAGVGWRLTLCLIAMAIGLQVLVECFVLKGDISRMNTVFKFYFQSWVLLGIAGSVSAAHWLGLAAARRCGWRCALVDGFDAAFGVRAFVSPVGHAFPDRLQD